MAIDITIDQQTLRTAIQHEYEEVAACPATGFHFHVGRYLAARLGYPEDEVDALPDAAVESFAGVGNPFALGRLEPGQVIIDLGSGAGFDAILAAMQVGADGKVIGIDMTPAMVIKARSNAEQLNLAQLEIREGYLEALPVESESADVVISNGVINLCPDKDAVLSEAYRALKPGGRLQIADIIVQREVPDDAKADIALWTG